MASNTNIEKPDWLTDEKIAKFKTYIKACSNPYTDEDFAESIPMGDEMDLKRYIAYYAKKILDQYGIEY
jgi:hypothetical protein